ncbi:5'-methylthioadenosine/S-adenosylhomocysteine nucleosidase family protein [Clostridium hydrogenum]|uniref:5'-methylthioadenosine/S-adenosylhomocysteine nucleosidase family protein n=1 Tax=Clostridium hydrogenum TaxID=2855764 RepID=UPI001F2557FD|nr:hypothetical protein [Clostridium hydrogenum]
MTYFLTALYYEAKGIISHYKMKKVVEAIKFQVFKGDNEMLIIAGTGGIKAVVATAYLLNCFGYKENDMLINLGICGAVKNNFDIGEVVLCNKLIDDFSNRSFYPDILFKHPFKEGSLQSLKGVMGQANKEQIEGDIIDEEGAFVYQVASMFLKPHNIHIIKIVSDVLNPTSVTKEKIQSLMEMKMPQIFNWLENRTAVKTEVSNIISLDEYKLLSVLTTKMKLTTAMNMELEKLFKQYKVRNGHVMDVVRGFAKIQCESKNEGKRVFGELKQRLMEL